MLLERQNSNASAVKKRNIWSEERIERAGAKMHHCRFAKRHATGWITSFRRGDPKNYAKRIQILGENTRVPLENCKILLCNRRPRRVCSLAGCDGDEGGLMFVLL